MNSLNDRIQNHPFFRGMKPEHLEILLKHARDAKFEPGEIVCRESDPANHCFLIESGCVALEAHAPANGTVFIRNLESGDVLGWSWLFPPFEWHFQARAIRETRAIELDGAHLLIAAEEDHDFGYELMKRVVQVLIHRVNATRKLLLLTATEPAFAGS